MFAALGKRSTVLIVMPKGTNAADLGQFGLARVIEYTPTTRNDRAVASTVSQVTKMIATPGKPLERPAPIRHVGPTSAPRNTIFISYSHKDRVWVERLRTMLAPAVATSGFSLWEDSKIQPGDKWRVGITSALNDAVVAVLLVSPSFLESHFIKTVELPKLLHSAARGGTRIVWVHIDSSLYEFTDIAAFQAAIDPKTPLAKTTGGRRGDALKAVAKAILGAYEQRVGAA